MTDQTTIWNLALDAAGSRSTVAGPQDTSPEAQILNRHWQPAIDQLLRAAHWNFARAQLSLALIADGSIGQTVPVPWIYEYAYPSDCVLARYVMPTFQTTPGITPAGVTVPYYLGPTVRFVVSSDKDASGNDTNVILTNQTQATLVYTKRITNPELFDAEFTEALRMFLAARIGRALTGSAQLVQMNFQLATDAVTAARARNGNEGPVVQDHSAEWMRVRGWANDWAYPDGSFFYYAPQNLTMIM